MRHLMLAALLSLAAALPAAASGPPPLAALSCAGCHGVGSTGSASVAGIAGRPAEEIVASLRAFRADQKPATIMNRIARGYSDDEIAAIAAWLAAQR